MKRIYFILLVLIYTSALAQTEHDSLWNVWSDETLNDSIRLKAIAELSRNQSQLSPLDTAYKTVMIMFDFAVKNEQELYQAKAYSDLGRIEWRKPNMAKALKYYTHALQLFEDINYKNGIAGTLWDIGLIYYQMGQYPQALAYHINSMELYEELDKSTSGILNNIGLIYEIVEDDAKALEYYNRSVKDAEERGWYNSTAVSNMADLYLKQGNPEKALVIYTEIKDSIEKERNEWYYTRMGWILRDIAEAHAGLNNFDLALSNYLLGFEYSKKDSLAIGIKRNELDLGIFYKRIGQIEPAIEWCTNGLNKAKKDGSIMNQSLACNCLYEAYKRRGDNTQALAYYETYQMLNDSLKLEEAAKSIQKMEFTKMLLADSLKQQEENLRMTLLHREEVQKKNNQRNIILGVGLLMLLLAVGFWTRLRYVRKSRALIQTEKDRSENLLLNILPAEIAEELKTKGKADARDYNMVSILFTDFIAFTQTSEKLSAKELVAEINVCFEAFDNICDTYQIEKIKTIGDAYMAAGGLPLPSENSIRNTVLAALEMQDFISNRKKENEIANNPAFKMRVGIHTGSVVAGIVGVKKFQYDIWGDTVNIASRIESMGEAGKVNISKATYNLVKDETEFDFESRGKIKAKGKGEIEMWFVKKAQFRPPLSKGK